MLAMDNMITNPGALHYARSTASCSYKDKVPTGLKTMEHHHHKRGEFNSDDRLIWQEKYYNTAHLTGMDTHQTLPTLPYTNPPLHHLARGPVQPPPSLTNEFHNVYNQSGKTGYYHNFNGGAVSAPTFHWHSSFHESTHQPIQGVVTEHTHANCTTPESNGPTVPGHTYSMNNRFDMFLRNQNQTNYFITSFTETSNNWHQQPSPIPKDNFNHSPTSKNVCPVCGKSYARPSTLKTHMRIHSGERPFLCEVCNKSFSQAANLTAHLRVHSGEKPFSCNICHKTFSQSSSVTTHMRTHSGDRPYKCPACRKGFSDSSTLTKHLRIHSGEKPYQCNYCNMSFSQSGNLNRHMKVHDQSRDNLDTTTSKMSSPRQIETP